MDEQQSGPSEINYLLLQLIRAYKEQKQKTLAYRALLIARDSSFADQHLQKALDDVQPLLSNRFQEAEGALLDGNNPLQVLRDFLKPVEN
jgi:hypothetical protein